MAESPEKSARELNASPPVTEAIERLRTGQVASLLVIVLMPVGSSLDYFVYRESLGYFFVLRVICSLLVLGLLFLHRADWRSRGYLLFGFPVHRLLGLPIALLPSFFMSVMIYERQGIFSPYYAGLNLVVLAVGVVVHWSVIESIIAVLGVAVMYFVACWLHQPNPLDPAQTSDPLTTLFSHSYFISLTGIIVVAGNYYFNKLRGELSRVRDQLAQSEKMASLGQMSAGIIHEINNPLNYATSGLFALRKKGRYLPQDRQVDYDETVTDIQDGINRVNNIVSNLRVFTHPMFTRPDIANLSDTSLAEVAEDAVNGLSHLAGDRVEIITTVPAELAVRADKQRLVQVVENLVRNSLDALASKSFNNGSKPTIWIESRAGKGFTTLLVRDNGPGIKPSEREKVFDPFFTTKDVGRGMGLGLTVCQGIVQAFGGRITLNSEPGKFCEFLLEFPNEQ